MSDKKKRYTMEDFLKNPMQQPFKYTEEEVARLEDERDNRFDDTVSKHHLTERELANIIYRAKLDVYKEIRKTLTILEDSHFRETFKEQFNKYEE